MTLDELTELECVALPGKGSCASMYTANTMASVSEALGLTVPGMASPAADDPAREAIVRRAAAALVDALESDRRPSAILTKASFENAIAVAAALGGSTNACLHVPALAGEAGIEFGLADIDRISRRTPQIAEMRPAGRFMMQDLHVEGGVPGRDARAPRRGPDRRRRDDRDGPDARRDARRRRAFGGAAHAGAAHRRRRP